MFLYMVHIYLQSRLFSSRSNRPSRLTFGTLIFSDCQLKLGTLTLLGFPFLVLPFVEHTNSP